uniref:Uncharacterized protein n=1 Tax=Desertifilum tharense IPPAS B-1220 TaxID=1781255 RepID=A0ACD5H3R3_9CYAN
MGKVNAKIESIRLLLRSTSRTRSHSFTVFPNSPLSTVTESIEVQHSALRGPVQLHQFLG